ncbi:hypothetical protein DL98DRAFT_18034 [Cadophora sp. DSE1049]|nr:hypothetical protein DL98DRAFT_18034 [Cadophora sp. DSE1049]
MNEFSHPDAISKSPRNSYTSTISSTRNSYASIISENTSSARTSYSSIFDPPLRVVSFSRTSDEFIPGSEETPSTSTAGESDDEEPEPVEEGGVSKRWTDEMQPEQKREVKSHIRTGSKDGPSALKELENVKDIICVAFGAFDRYFISWEDMDGEFHQESHKLPSALHKWLFFTDGNQASQTRDIPTLQVSFGSNDEFFASDKNGKISYRDSTPPTQSQSQSQPPSGKRVPPSIATVARGLGFMRRKAYTVSSPSPTLPKAIEENLTGSRLERRKTYMDGQPSSILTSRVENLQPLEPIREPGDSSQQMKSWTPKHERRRSIFAVSEGQLKRLSRRSTLIEGRPEPTVEEREAQSVDQMGQRMIENQRSISRSPTRSSPGDGVLPLALEARQETTKQDRRRSLLVSTLPIRVSWPDTKTILQARERVERAEIAVKEIPSHVAKPSYANAEMQTSAGLSTFMQQQAMSPVQCDFSPQQHISIGVMSDFFRCQYRLGDALAFV